MKITKLIMAAFVAATMLSSCSQEGPAGPTGPTGTDGLNGATGPTGAANVLVSTGTLPAASWIQSSSSTNVYYQQVTVTNLTDGVNDAVMAYVQGTAAGADYFGLPITNFLANNDALSFSYSSAATGIVTFYYTNTVTTTVVPAVDLNIKVVVIPPAVMKQHPGLNLSDYKAVMAALGQTSNCK